jgi:ABC-type dipeptide/oligopeptide/nickel transport system permease subunit
MIVLALLVSRHRGPHSPAYTYDEINKDDVWLGPLTNGHLIGTDSLGRDLMARLLMGLRVSLAIGSVPPACRW